MTRGLWLLSLLTPTACSHGSGGPVRQADGGYTLSCKGRLSDCLRHAERLCKDDGYAVSEAHDVRDLAGHEQGQSQILIERSDATVYCGSRGLHVKRPPIALTRESTIAPVAPTPFKTPAALEPRATPALACVPGSTQACVGPAGCSGGQACAGDGARYEPCNCGP